MKSILLTFITIFAFNANASFFQTYCSNAEGTITSADGHVENYQKYMEVSYDMNTGVETKKVIEWNWGTQSIDETRPTRFLPFVLQMRNESRSKNQIDWTVADNLKGN